MRNVNLSDSRILRLLWRAAIASLIMNAGILIAGGKDGRPLAVSGPGSEGARSLSLAPNLSFTDDSSSNFPIRGENLQDGAIAGDRPTIIFFGTSHCWNTNREAERFVALYAKEKDTVRFLVVDVDHPSAQQRPLVSRFFHGSIPTLAVLDRSGKVVYNQAGETSTRRADTSRLEEILNGAR
jgi:hypothetical protein